MNIIFMRKKSLALTLMLAFSCILGGGDLMGQKTLPYSYGFEFTGTHNATNAANALTTEGWTTTNASATSMIKTYPYHTGGESYCFYVDTDKDYQYLISPQLDNVPNLCVELYVRVTNSTNLKYQIGYTTKSDTPDVTTDFTWTDLKAVSSTSYILASELFLTNGIKYIAIKFDRNNDTNTNHYLTIDDITLSIAYPTNIVVSPMSSLATLSWTTGYDESHWLLYYSTTNTAPTDYTTNVISIEANPTYTITGLTKNETYYAWVCAENNGIYSTWGGPVEFTPADEFTLTVNNGTNTNSNAPLYGSGAANGTKSQFMVPATMLSNMANTQITKLEFYAAAANISFGSAEYNIYMAETTASKFETASFENWESMSLIYNGSLSTDGNKMMTIDLKTPYIYSGGNLIIGCCSSAYGTNSYISWYGVNNSNDANLTLSCTANSSHVYNAESYVAFSPKITFTSQYITFDNCNWGTGATTTAAQNVELKNNVTVANGTNAIASIIEMASGSSLTIENGATLTCNNIIGATSSNFTIEDGGQLITSSTGVQATVKKETYAATTKDTKTDYYWYAISSAVANPSISSATNIASGTYDLYRYNEEKNAGLPWENYKNGDYSLTFTTLEPGRGYLYRNASNLSITMTGEINVADFNYAVTKTEDGALAGFNLIGNPYSHDIYKGDGTAIPNGSGLLRTGFYYMEPTTGKWTIGTDGSTAIKPNQGILVQTDANGSIEMTNTNSNGSSKSNNDNIMFKVANSQYSDETYAWFDKGRGLNKISHRNAEVPMLYINQDGEDYAIATMSDDIKTFSLNFKAMTMGKYTLSYKTKGEFNYLHVIDRFTGEDVDMLLEGEYSFVASPSDSDARFIVRLEYTSNNGTNDSSVFAYQSGNEIIVSGEGELQIFDVMGRKISTHQINGVETVNVNAHGVYIFKLNAKTQKIIIK